MKRQIWFPKIVQYRIIATGEILDRPPSVETHHWSREDCLAHCRKISRFIKPEIPSTQPYEVIVHDLMAYEALRRQGLVT